MSYNPDNQLSEVGHPGKWKGIVTCAQNSETNFTVTDGSTATAAVLFADAGGEVKGAFKAIEASISKVVVHDTSNADIYVLKRNYQIR